MVRGSSSDGGGIVPRGRPGRRCTTSPDQRPRRRVRQTRERASRRGRSARISTPCSICCHGGPGEDGTLQGALDLAGVAYAGPTAMGAALGMDKLAFGALMVDAGLPVLPRLSLDEDSRGARVPAAIHPQAALRRLVHRHRGRRGLPDRPRPSRGKHPPPARSGPRAVPRGPVRPAACGSNLAFPAAVGHRAAAQDSERRRDPRLSGQVRRGRRA